MQKKSLCVLLALLAAAYAAAPAWVTAGANLNYSVGSDTFSFKVVQRNSTDVKIETMNLTNSKITKPTENASGLYGQFWFDSDELEHAGGSVGDFLVTDEGKMTFAGKEWDTITLESTISGYTTTRIYDVETGLLLKQSVNAPGAPLVTLLQYYLPGISPAPAQPQPPAQPPSQPPAQNGTTTTTPTPQPNTTQPPSTPPPSNQPYYPPTTTPPETEPPEEEGPDKKPITDLCCPGAFILALISGMAVLRR